MSIDESKSQNCLERIYEVLKDCNMLRNELRGKELFFQSGLSRFLFLPFGFPCVAFSALTCSFMMQGLVLYHPVVIAFSCLSIGAFFFAYFEMVTVKCYLCSDPLSIKIQKGRLGRLVELSANEIVEFDGVFGSQANLSLFLKSSNHRFLIRVIISTILDSDKIKSKLDQVGKEFAAIFNVPFNIGTETQTDFWHRGEKRLLNVSHTYDPRIESSDP